MKKLVLALLLCVPMAGHTVVISTSIGDYEITNLSDGYNANAALFMQQPWWGNFDLAREFAAAYAASPDRLRELVSFGYALGCTEPEPTANCDGLNSAPTVDVVASFGEGDIVNTGFFLPAPGECCAVAREVGVPESGTLVLFGTLLGAGLFRRKLLS